jgi:predicted CXXCH cytochrome family protein
VTGRIAASGSAVAAVLLLAAACARRERGTPPPQEVAPAAYVGRASCGECHAEAVAAWTGSDHDLAMQEATPETVLGDFDDAAFEAAGVVTRFTREGDVFRVRTEGPDGRADTWDVAYVFGVRPLQQYLVRFPGGRLQSLTVAWDVAAGRWYSLHADARVPPGDWLHWTGGGQNWNGMCADCHSTRLEKGYDAASDAYATTFAEIDVSCEACHGPASRHVEWARLPESERPPAESAGLVVPAGSATAREQVEQCALCHSRRSPLQDFHDAPGADLLDRVVPTLLEEGLYFPDGQIQDEVYEYASFLQTEMYRHGVRCTDCHDPHSGRRKADGNELCLRCHARAEYETTEHHFHRPLHEGRPSPAWSCTSCHMPERTYMGIDRRADHGVRVPRPDLSVALGTPNACSQPGCHADRSAQWAADACATWYGPERPRHWGETIAAAREGRVEAREELLRLTTSRAVPAIVRATAVSLLDRYPPGDDGAAALRRALDDEEPLVRRAAAGRAHLLPLPDRAPRLAPLLADPVAGVRVEAARVLAEAGLRAPAGSDSLLAAALAEYERSLAYQMDLPSAGYHLGNLRAAQGRPEEAEAAYRTSLRVDSLFVASRVNLGLLLGRLGEAGEAERELRAAVHVAPELFEANYNLGLLLAESDRMAEARTHLEAAARAMPGFARVHYNLALLLSRTGEPAAARAAISRALELEPGNADFRAAAARLAAGSSAGR